MTERALIAFGDEASGGADAGAVVVVVSSRSTAAALSSRLGKLPRRAAAGSGARARFTASARRRRAAFARRRAWLLTWGLGISSGLRPRLRARSASSS